MTDKPMTCYRMKGEGADIIGKADTITVTDPAHIRALFAMTPYYWKTAPADCERLYAQDKLVTEIAFDLLLYKKDVNL